MIHMITKIVFFLLGVCCTFLQAYGAPSAAPRERLGFNEDWRFHLGEVKEAASPDYIDKSWRMLCLTHDWAIEGDFSERNPSGVGGGALHGGIGWYRKEFVVNDAAQGQVHRIEFDGVYMNAEVFIN